MNTIEFLKSLSAKERKICWLMLWSLIGLALSATYVVAYALATSEVWHLSAISSIPWPIMLAILVASVITSNIAYKMSQREIDYDEKHKQNMQELQKKDKAVRS